MKNEAACLRSARSSLELIDFYRQNLSLSLSLRRNLSLTIALLVLTGAREWKSAKLNGRVAPARIYEPRALLEDGKLAASLEVGLIKPENV